MAKVLDNNIYGSIGEYIKENAKDDSTINVSSPIFTIYAFEELREILEKSGKFNFLFNAPAFIKDIKANNKEVKEFELQMQKREKDVSEFALEINLKNNLDQNQVASKCYKFIKEKAEVKSVIQNGVVTPSCINVNNPYNDSFIINGNTVAFSMDGLGYTKDLRFDFNTVEDNANIVNQYEQFFNNVFSNEEVVQDVKEELLKHLSNLYKENSPKLLYYLTLYNIFGEKLLNMDDMARIKERTGITETKVWNSLYNFQHDAVVGAIKKLELYNGCIIADSVGLGKTFEALAIIKYYELRNDRVLVLCPKKLRSNWTGFKQNSVTNILADDRFNYDVLNHTDLSRDFGKSGDINLETINWGNYDLLVIDESHNFRNDNAYSDRLTRYQKLMQQVIKAGVKTKVLMLSATPVNNSLTDLKNQIRFITEDDDEAFKESAGIDNIGITLRLAQQAFNTWSKLDKEDQTTENLLPMLDYDFFNLLNIVTIARSRKHIQKYYDTKDIGKFPTRNKPKSIKSDIDLQNEFPELSYVNSKIASLTLAMYSPMLYILPTKLHIYEDMYDKEVKGGQSVFKQADREKAIVNLMRINVLKRMESSVNSFALTLKRMLDKLNVNLEALDKGADLTLEDENTEEFDDENVPTIGGKIKIKVSDIDVIKFRQDLLEDKAIIEELYQAAKMIDPSRDAKLNDLKEEIIDKINEPLNGNNKKVIVFTTFSDTAHYLYENIEEWLKEKYGFFSATVTGNSTVTNCKKIPNNFESILVHFSPKSNQYDTKGNEIQLLIATDCISEGQNLQDCDYLINYDIHWNPVRIVQRFGRIDRIGSNNDQIQLVNFWPNMSLDEYINLEKRVRNKMVMLDISATGDDNIIDPELREAEYRKQQLEQLQNEVLDVEELKGGISITDLTLDDFVMSLDRFMHENPGMLEKYPTGVYAITNIDSKFQDECEPGVIYCLQQLNHSSSQEAATSLYPYFLVYVKENGEIKIKNTSPKSILDIYKVLCQSKDNPIEEMVSLFNKETQNGNDMSKYTDLLEKAVFDIKGVAEKKGIDSLFKIGQTSFLNDRITGLNDFKLISFLVIK